MTSDLAKYVLPSRFIERYRPVKSHRHMKALGGYFFEPNAARFFIRMVTVDPVPPEAVWTVSPDAASSAGFRVTSLRDESAVGYVICQTPYADGERIEFPLVRRLTQRARIRIALLRELSDHIRQAGPLVTGSEIVAFVQRRIDELKV